jgi:hypothetical protein
MAFLGYEAAVAFDALLTGLIADEQPLDVPASPPHTTTRIGPRWSPSLPS